MSPFSYKASDAEGKIIEGVMEADGEAAVVASLRSQGYIPLDVRAGTVAASGRRRISLTLPKIGGGKSVKSRDLMVFTRELATLLRAGMPLDRSLESLASLSENPVLSQVVGTVLADVQQGKSLSEALRERPEVFPTLYVNMVRAGEVGGVLESVLERLADYLESSQKARDEIRAAMTYPMILGVVGSLSIVILLTYVLPKFALVFADIGAALPASTRFVMSMSEALQSYWWVAVVATVGARAGFRRYTVTPSGRYNYDRWRLSLPLLGDLLTKQQIATFARTLGTMLKSGVPLLQSLEIVGAILSNSVIVTALESVHKGVSEGKGLSGPLEKTGVFPPLSIQMVSVGEDTGRLDDMLNVVADHYERDVSNAVTRLVNMMEPAMLLIMGLVTGFIVIAMMSAVFSVNQMAL